MNATEWTLWGISIDLFHAFHEWVIKEFFYHLSLSLIHPQIAGLDLKESRGPSGPKPDIYVIPHLREKNSNSNSGDYERPSQQYDQRDRYDRGDRDYRGGPDSRDYRNDSRDYKK